MGGKEKGDQWNSLFWGGEGGAGKSILQLCALSTQGPGSGNNSAAKGWPHPRVFSFISGSSAWRGVNAAGGEVWGEGGIPPLGWVPKMLGAPTTSNTPVPNQG